MCDFALQMLVVGSGAVLAHHRRFLSPWSRVRAGYVKWRIQHAAYIIYHDEEKK